MALNTKTNYDDEKRFSRDNVSLAQDFPIKYAAFNAYQMRDLITRKQHSAACGSGGDDVSDSGISAEPCCL